MKPPCKAFVGKMQCVSELNCEECTKVYELAERYYKERDGVVWEADGYPTEGFLEFIKVESGMEFEGRPNEISS